MMQPAVRNRLIIGLAIVLVGAVVAYEMFFSLTPPRHADHDHAIATLDAGGFLWIEPSDGSRRNLVGQPGKVLVLHWFDPTATDNSEQAQAASFAATFADDPMVEILFVAQASSWDGVREWAQAAGIAAEKLYLDKDARTGDLMGVRRLPETLIYDPIGLQALQAMGSTDWTNPDLAARIEGAKAGVEEIH
ncbi:MAG: TlpA family protein disulfide reductase [Thermoanaerobaculales bacterium]